MEKAPDTYVTPYNFRRSVLPNDPQLRYTVYIETLHVILSCSHTPPLSVEVSRMGFTFCQQIRPPPASQSAPE
jgi:hypothetical protein